ncbi:antitoxin Xre/MbcA/ParS toxin-binding domain-containing protein [Variovorax atrisoli]|uniref:antitoxin Xre/MbcA/ParS toxin-binding domain-containing protein n=1 Tax=Variovorax atrisoli TaxID=3394203 RepID=UPI00339522E7
MNQEISDARSAARSENDFEWLHHAFTLEKRTRAKALGAEGASNKRHSVAVVAIGGDKSITVDFRKFYEVGPMEQVCIVKRGVNACLVDVLAVSMQMPKEKLISTLGLTRATIQRKSRQQAALSSNESSRVVGVGKLIGQVQMMADESGTSEDFDAAAWMAQWWDQPLPALNGGCPRDLMDTAEGQVMVSLLLGRLQRAVYA